jgi:hypothetical protein
MRFKIENPLSNRGNPLNKSVDFTGMKNPEEV